MRFSWLAACFVVGLGLCSTAAAVAPNPLESAYWRFEEGSANSPVNSAVADPVKDSINQNHLDAFNAAAAPTYTTNKAPTALKSGLANSLALDFIRQPGANDDLFTLHADGEHGKGLAKKINNGIIAPGGGFTIEGAFNTTSTTEFQTIIGKEGRPGLGRLGGDFIENLPTLSVKTRGDNQLLQIEQWDGAGNLVQVSSLAAIQPSTDVQHWYYFAVVNTGSTLSLYLDSNDSMGYQLQGTTPVSGALFQGLAAATAGDYNANGTVDAADYTVWRDKLGSSTTLPNDSTPGTVVQADYDVWKSNFGMTGGGTADWDHSWTVGRGQFGGGVADFFDGAIDEVRITNTALAPSQFLFAPPGAGSGASVPEPAGIVLAILATGALATMRRRMHRVRMGN